MEEDCGFFNQWDFSSAQVKADKDKWDFGSSLLHFRAWCSYSRQRPFCHFESKAQHSRQDQQGNMNLGLARKHWPNREMLQIVIKTYWEQEKHPRVTKAHFPHEWYLQPAYHTLSRESIGQIQQQRAANCRDLSGNCIWAQSCTWVLVPWIKRECKVLDCILALDYKYTSSQN